MLFPPLLTSQTYDAVCTRAKEDRARPIRSWQRFGGAHEPIAHRRPLREIGRHFDIDDAQALRVEQAKARVEIAGVRLRIERELDDSGVGHVEVAAMAPVKPKGGCARGVMHGLLSG